MYESTFRFCEKNAGYMESMFIATIMSLYNYKCSVFFSEKTNTTYKYLEQTAHKDKVYKKHSATPVIISKLSEWCVYVERDICKLPKQTQK